MSWGTTDERPLVDVGVVTWNTAELTADALRRLMDSDQGVDIRLLVRDNASSDDTVDTLRRLVPEAEIDAGAENLGFAGGVNTLIARSTAPWFFLLNSDAWPLDGAIATLVASARARADAAAVVPRIEFPDGRLQHSTHPFPSLAVAADVSFRWQRIGPQRADELFLEGTWMHDRPRRVDWAHGAAMLIPRSALDRVGCFDERFFFYGEDLEWCWRARELGMAIWFDPAAVVRHVGSASAEKLFARKKDAAKIRNSLRFYRRAHGTSSAIAWWAVNTAGSALRVAKATRRRDKAAAAHWAALTRAHLTALLAAEHRRRRERSRSRMPRSLDDAAPTTRA
jgi:N-acetylglucosaminyl-diphospho-decaprenol L-rhamnosyltransferase